MVAKDFQGKVTYKWPVERSIQTRAVASVATQKIGKNSKSKWKSFIFPPNFGVNTKQMEPTPMHLPNKAPK